MAARNVSFNGNTLQTSYITISNVDDASTPTREISLYKLGHANASKIPYDQYTSRNVAISGTIYGDSVVDLDARIDTFKGYFNGVDKNLDIDYNNTTRRYIATMQGISINRPGGLAYAEFTVNFVCTLPFGRDAASTTLCNFTQRQLLSNSSFSVNTTGWAVLLGSTISRTSGVGNYDGSAGFACQINTTGSGNSGITTSTLQAVTAGTTYTFSAYLKVPVGVTVVIQLDTFNSTPTYQRSISSTIVGDGTFQRASVTATIATGETGVNCITQCATATTYYMDACLFEVGSSPSTVFDSALRGPNTYADTFTFGGTAPLQQPIITLQYTAGTLGAGTVSIGNNGNGQQITVTRTWVLNDILIVDVPNKICYVNNVEVDFVGAFPEFAPGVGVLGYSTSVPTSGQLFSYRVEYYPQYL